MRWADLEQKSQSAYGLGGIICKGQDMTVLAQALIQRMNPIENVFSVGEIIKHTENKRICPASCLLLCILNISRVLRGRHARCFVTNLLPDGHFNGVPIFTLPILFLL